jgi:hypothetical protein
MKGTPEIPRRIWEDMLSVTKRYAIGDLVLDWEGCTLVQTIITPGLCKIR